MTTTSILIADDHGIVREGLKRLLEAESDFEVCAEASDGREVLTEVERTHPDVVVLDITMPQLGGLETLERLREQHPDLKVVLLSVHGEAPMVHSAAALGVNGYVLKNGQATEVVSAVRAVTRGGSYFSPPVARELVEQIRAPRTDAPDPLGALSGREREVLKLIAEGLSAKEIGRSLSISAKTVEAHRTSLMRKLGARKATELVRVALRHGVIEV
jgi:DNA-binding NarL/FixJ family response regulator